MVRRFTLIGIAVLIAAVAATFLFAQRPISRFLFDRATDQRVGIDRSAQLPDGINVYVCGSGSPMADATRAGPCLAVLAGDTAIVIDAGSGSVRKLGAMGFPFPRLDAAFLTHLHSDHLDGLGELMLQAWIAGGRSAPLPVHGPVGTAQVVDGFVQAYSIDRGYRIAHHGPEVARPGGFGAVAQEIDMAALEAADRDGVVYSHDGLKVKVQRVDHSPAAPAFAYRVEYGGRAVVISGDTSYSADLARFAKGADVIFHDALNPQMVGRLGELLAERDQPDLARIMHDIQDYHASPTQAAQVAEQAGAKALVLYHLVPAPPSALIEPAFVGDARAVYSGDLRLAQDGMLISLPAGETTITFDQLL